MIMSGEQGSYYLPNPSPYPLITSLGLFTLALGFIFLMNDVAVTEKGVAAFAKDGVTLGPWIMVAGALVVVFMMFRWFGIVIGESESGVYDKQVDNSFRMGMAWFIFSEIYVFCRLSGLIHRN